MKLFVNAILAVVMFASAPVFAATGLVLKKDIVFSEGGNSVTLAGVGTDEHGSAKCRLISYRYGNSVPNGVIPAGTIFPIKSAESRKVFPDIDGVGAMWQIRTSVYAPLGEQGNSFDVRVSCQDAYHLFMSFPSAKEAVQLFSEYIEAVNLN